MSRRGGRRAGSGREELSSLTIPRAEAREQLDDRLLRGEELLRRPIGSNDDLQSVRREYYTWNDYNEELLRRVSTTSAEANRYKASIGISFVGPRTLAEDIRDLHRDINMKLRRLESVREKLDLFPEPTTGPASRPTQRPRQPNPEGSLFIVHGRNEGRKEQVARFIDRLVTADVVILHEQADKGRTIIEKFEDHAAEVAFAVILLTADDVGGLAPVPRDEDDATEEIEAELNPRARQNVVFEMGFFVSALGRPNVVVLHEEGVELPSDMSGVLYTPLDEHGAWKNQLAREIRAAGIDVDLDALV
jgi:predicted nucleotide-binding protein